MEYEFMILLGYLTERHMGKLIRSYEANFKGAS